jgi:hypothetical protein
LVARGVGRSQSIAALLLDNALKIVMLGAEKED